MQTGGLLAGVWDVRDKGAQRRSGIHPYAARTPTTITTPPTHPPPRRSGPWQAKCGLAGSAGPYVGAYQQVLSPGSASLKDTTWEGGHRVFGIVSGPGIAAGSVSHAIASTLDIWPTVAALTGVPLPTDRSYDGVDLSPVLFDGAPKVRDVLFIPDTSGATHGNLTAARIGNYSVYWQTNVRGSARGTWGRRRGWGRGLGPLRLLTHVCSVG
jgi:hypothetical protein